MNFYELVRCSNIFARNFFLKKSKLGTFSAKWINDLQDCTEVAYILQRLQSRMSKENRHGLTGRSNRNENVSRHVRRPPDVEHGRLKKQLARPRFVLEREITPHRLDVFSVPREITRSLLRPCVFSLSLSSLSSLSSRFSLSWLSARFTTFPRRSEIHRGHERGNQLAKQSFGTFPPSPLRYFARPRSRFNEEKRLEVRGDEFFKSVEATNQAVQIRRFDERSGFGKRGFFFFFFLVDTTTKRSTSL